MKTWIAGLLMLVLTLGTDATANAATVQYDIDREAPFHTWTSFAWKVPAPAARSIAERRITNALEDGFQARGYTLQEGPLGADFTITWRAVTWREAYATGLGRAVGFGRTMRVETETKGTLVVDVFDRRSGRLVWHGTVSDALADDPEGAQETTTKAVAKLLKKFPARAQVGR